MLTPCKSDFEKTRLMPTRLSHQPGIERSGDNVFWAEGLICFRGAEAQPLSAGV